MNYKIMRTAVLLLVFFALLAQASALKQKNVALFQGPNAETIFYNSEEELKNSVYQEPPSGKVFVKMVRGEERRKFIHFGKGMQRELVGNYFEGQDPKRPKQGVSFYGISAWQEDARKRGLKEEQIQKFSDLLKNIGVPQNRINLDSGKPLASNDTSVLMLNSNSYPEARDSPESKKTALSEMLGYFDHEWFHAKYFTDWEFQKKTVNELFDNILSNPTDRQNAIRRTGDFLLPGQELSLSFDKPIADEKNQIHWINSTDEKTRSDTRVILEELPAYIAGEKGAPGFLRNSPPQFSISDNAIKKMDDAVKPSRALNIFQQQNKARSFQNIQPKPAPVQATSPKPVQPVLPQGKPQAKAFSSQNTPRDFRGFEPMPLDIEILVNEFGEETFSYTPAKNPNNPQTTKNFRSAAEQIKQLEQEISSLKRSGQGKAAETIARSLEQEKARLEAKMRELQKQQGKAVLEKPQPEKPLEKQQPEEPKTETIEGMEKRIAELEKELQNPNLNPLQKHKKRTEKLITEKNIEIQEDISSKKKVWENILSSEKNIKQYWESKKKSAESAGNKEGIREAEERIKASEERTKKAEAEIDEYNKERKGIEERPPNIDSMQREFDFLDNLDRQGKLSNLSQQEEQELIQKIKQDFHGQKIEETKPEEKPQQKEPETKEEIQEKIAELEKEIAATGDAAKIAELEGLQKKLNELTGQQQIVPTPIPDQLPPVDQKPDQTQQASLLPEEPMQKCTNPLGVQPGRGEYEELGFDKLSLDWSWKTSREEVCNARLKEVNEENGVGVYDETKQGIIKYFCDGAQLSASALHMAELVKEVTDRSIKASRNLLERAEELKGKTPQWENSVDSWRFAKKQAIVEERQNLDRKPKNHLFFVKDDDIVIDTKKSQELQSKGNELNLNIGTINPDNTEKLQQALEKITESEFGKNIAGTWDASEEKQNQSFRDEISQKSIPEIYGAENLSHNIGEGTGNKSNYSAQKEIRVLTQAEFTNFMQKLFVPFQEDKGERKKRFTDAGIENMRKTAKAFAETKKSCAGVIDEQVLKAAGISEETEDGKKLKGMNVAFCHSKNANDPNQADICWICNAGGKGRAEGTGLAEVKIKFLQDFTNAVLKQTAKNASSQKIKGTPTPLSYGFKIGLRHAPETEFKRELFRASDIEELSSQTFKVTGGTEEKEPFPLLYRQRDEMFNEYYFRFVDFKANTITDSLNQEFRRDFTEKYSEKSELAKRFSEWITPVLGTGTYPMKLLYKYGFGSWELKIAEDQYRKIKTLADNTEMGNYKRNVFFYLPWDGDVAQSLRFRKGYGVGFVEMPATQYYGISHLSSSGTALQQDAGAFFYETQGFAKVDFFKASTPENQSFDSRVQATKLGKILLIDIGGQSNQESAFSFSPSVPFTWQLETGAGEKLGLVYDFTEPRMPNTGIIRWNDKATGKDVIEKNISVQEAELCGMQNPPSTLQGMLYYASQIPAKRFIGYTFMPLNLVPEIVAYCGASGRVTLNGQPVPVKAGAEQSGPVQATVRGNGANGAGGEGGLKHIRDFIELMKADLVCVEGTPTEYKIELRWNTEHQGIAGSTMGATGNEIAKNP